VLDVRDGPYGAVIGFFTRLRNRPDRRYSPNVSGRFQEKFANEWAKQPNCTGSTARLTPSANSGIIVESGYLQLLATPRRPPHGLSQGSAGMAATEALRPAGNQ
jgi:hypothetical protein